MEMFQLSIKGMALDMNLQGQYPVLYKLMVKNSYVCV